MSELAEPLVIEEVQFRFRPPPADAAALPIEALVDGVLPVADDPSYAFLALFSRTEVGMVGFEDGVERLVWVFVQEGVGMVRVRALFRRSGPSDPGREPETGTAYAVVDALTGEHIMAATVGSPLAP